MNINDLPQGSFQYSSSADSPNPPMNINNLTPDQSKTVLSHANQSLSPFFSPLQNIASGNSQDNSQHAIGALKQIGSDLSSVGAQNSGPVGKDMLAHAPALAQDLSGLSTALTPSNPAQQQGATDTSVAEAMIPLDAAGGAAKDVVSGLAAKTAEKKATQTAIKALTPKMTSGELEAAGAAGKGVVPKIGAPGINMAKDPGFMKMVDATKGLIKGKSAIQDINSVRGALTTEAEALKSKIVASGKDIIYPFKELASKIADSEEPISLKGTQFEKQIAPLKQAAIQIAQKNGGTISSLFDTRKEFDALVDKTWPNLWDKENAPMRNAVTAVRNTMNDFIEQNLPDAGYKSSLDTQSNFYRAIDNLSTKVPDEIKGNATWAQRHPIITGAAKGAAYLAGADALNQTAKDLGLPSL